MDEIIVSAPAKINLSLDIIGIRPDGYHELEMIMQSIALHDIIKIKKARQGIKLDCSNKSLPHDRDNIAFQAAELILEEADRRKGVEIYIDKKIPIAAGLAGGSTDAAAVLNGINKLYQLGFNRDKLVEMARKIGSDVAFCLAGGTALASGRGDKLQQLPDIERQDLLLINPSVRVSTVEVYREYDQMKPELKIPTSSLVEIINTCNKIEWDEGWANVLEPVTMKMVDDVQKIKMMLREFGVKLALMSGSGPTVFAVLNGPEQGEYIRKNWLRKDDIIISTRTLKKDFLNFGFYKGGVL